MSNIAIQVENISKQYRLGQVGRKSLSHDINRWWHTVRGKEDPYLKIGQENDRTKKGSSEYVWALRDVSFNVTQGEVLGIIGRNGAGKSTLLKILSKVTSPTVGTIKTKGRTASLLEVGTGFHPDLSGRDNIFLNGAILGMTKKEIASKFDEMVDFAGVERYIDTPVKRYSSGMYVRLAFAVAAHLEPEILIVDEVLAVGDAEFQKKCLGKMKDVSEKDGRTILFVSHNMAAISKLCDTCLLMQHGKLVDYSKTNIIIDKYLQEQNKGESYYSCAQDKNSSSPFVTKAYLTSEKSTDIVSSYHHDENIILKIDVATISHIKKFTAGVAMLDKRKEKIFTSHFDVENTYDSTSLTLTCKIPGNLFNQGEYSFDMALFQKGGTLFEYLDDKCSFEIVDMGSNIFYQAGENIGPLRINCNWSTINGK